MVEVPDKRRKTDRALMYKSSGSSRASSEGLWVPFHGVGGWRHLDHTWIIKDFRGKEPGPSTYYGRVAKALATIEDQLDFSDVEVFTLNYTEGVRLNTILREYAPEEVLLQKEHKNYHQLPPLCV